MVPFKESLCKDSVFTAGNTDFWAAEQHWAICVFPDQAGALCQLLAWSVVVYVPSHRWQKKSFIAQSVTDSFSGSWEATLLSLSWLSPHVSEKVRAKSSLHWAPLLAPCWNVTECFHCWYKDMQATHLCAFIYEWRKNNLENLFPFHLKSSKTCCTNCIKYTIKPQMWKDLMFLSTSFF